MNGAAIEGMAVAAKAAAELPSSLENSVFLFIVSFGWKMEGIGFEEVCGDRYYSSVAVRRLKSLPPAPSVEGIVAVTTLSGPVVSIWKSTPLTTLVASGTTA